MSTTDVTRRRFLTIGGMAVAAGLTGARAGADPMARDPEAVIEPHIHDAASGRTSFKLSNLPYGFSELEPYIDSRTMEIHHGRHHAGYVRNLNGALEPHSNLQKKSIEDLLHDIPGLPEDIQTAVRNNGGGHYNHDLFWNVMSPDGGGKPEGSLSDAVDRDFGGFESLRDKFSGAAGTVFGSGWAWLIVKDDGHLAVTSTPNQDNPLMTGIADVTGTPILGLDVWEHAYYLHYQNRRADYIEAWWNVVNWTQVQNLYELAAG